MICEECGNNSATVHLTKIVNEKVNKLHLCAECANKHNNFDFDSTFSIHNFLTGLLDSSQNDTLKVGSTEPNQCSKCKMTYGKFRQTGRLGCSHCYKSFNQKLNPLFKRIHGHDSHVGKVPKKAGGVFRVKKEIDNLRNKLESAVQKEEFEKAAQLRDQIRELQKEVES